MEQNKINEMAAAIVAANAHTSEEIIAALKEYWAGKMAVIWDRSDVLGKAWERGMLLTNEQADDLLEDLRHCHDPELGITWTTIECALDETDPLDIELLNLARLVDYPGIFRVFWKENSVDQSEVFNTGNRDLFHALTFASQKADQVEGEVRVCVIDAGDNGYPVACYDNVDGKLVIKNASAKA